MQLTDFLGLLHPVIAIIFVFPLIGTVVNFAWQTRQRRLQILAGSKSKIPHYIGITAALLMIFSLAIVQDIYQDKSNRWRIVHTILNCIALLLFIGQGMTGTRDLLEIPLSWQEPYIYQCDFAHKTCPTPNFQAPK
ncbi:MAG: DUF4079 domain-containing protein [Nostoc sp.]|uniref:DUF4079 domain-containing protein n=1 Tax=Nostoc sp. TaxID=1180 RepID=UPI002FF578CC